MEKEEKIEKYRREIIAIVNSIKDAEKLKMMYTYNKSIARRGR